MILQDLLSIARLGEREPLPYWRDKLNDSRARLISALQPIADSLEEGTSAKQNMLDLLGTLRQDQPDEFALAKGLSHIQEVLIDPAAPKQDRLIGDYLAASARFFRDAQTRNALAAQRLLLKKRLSMQQQQAYDLRLFQQEGMSYILEFYLALYKALSEAPTAEAKLALIESNEINLGYGRVPGLRKDVAADEPLVKFILLILNDQAREELERAFYAMKHALTDEHDPESHIAGLRAFLLVLLSVFRHTGVERLTNRFLTPYGPQPKLEDIRL